MEVRFNEKSTKDVVEGYYKKYEDFDCCMEFCTSVREMKHPTRSLPPVRYVDMSFILNGILNVDGKSIEVSVPASFDEIKAVFKTTLENTGYDVNDVQIVYNSDESFESSGSRFKYVSVDMSTKRKIK